MLAIEWGLGLNWSYWADGGGFYKLCNCGLSLTYEPEFEGYGVKVNKGASENVSKEVKKTSDAPIIEDWVSDCDEDETVVLESLNVQKPKQADQPRKVSQNPRNNSTSWNTPMPKKLGVGFQFTPKACFVCGSFNHLIKDYDFHDKRMVQKPVLNNVKKGTGQREVRPVWTNAMRVNHQKISNSRRNFAPTAVLPRLGLVPLSMLGKKLFQELQHSCAVGKKEWTKCCGEQGDINVVKPKAYWAWRPKIKMINHVYKNQWNLYLKQFTYVGITAENKKCRAPICWDQVGERILEGPEMIEVTNEKVAVAREKLKEAQTRQKSYANRHRRALEFQPGRLRFHDRVGEVSIVVALPPQLSHGSQGCFMNHPERKPLGDEESIRDFLSSFSSMIPFDVLFYLGHMFRPLDFFYVIHVDLIIGSRYQHVSRKEVSTEEGNLGEDDQLEDLSRRR
ncbi:hypothetical protein Tco_0079722 [Tanacetum coccineum]